MAAAADSDGDAAAAPRARGRRAHRPVAPHFVVAVVNDTTILRCVLSPGAATIVSDPARLPLRQCEDPETGIPAGFLRVLLYSPNLITDEYPSFAWDADLDIDGNIFFIGSVSRRCEVMEQRFVLPNAPRTAVLRLHRLRTAPVRSVESEALAQRTLELLQDPRFNPRGGSVPLQHIAEEMHRRCPEEFRSVVGGEHLGSFRSFVGAHSTRFSIFHYAESEINARRMANVSAFDERVAIRKGVRESLPPLMPFGNNEADVIALLKEALKDCDSHVHVLLRQLSKHEVFRVAMAPGFSSLMHWLQKHRDRFCWSTDPQALCTIGLVRDRPSMEGVPPGPTDDATPRAAEDPDGGARAAREDSEADDLSADEHIPVDTNQDDEADGAATAPTRHRNNAFHHHQHRQHYQYRDGGDDGDDAIDSRVGEPHRDLQRLGGNNAE